MGGVPYGAVGRRAFVLGGLALTVVPGSGVASADLLGPTTNGWARGEVDPSGLWGPFPTARDEVALTFDDGPDPEVTAGVLRLLAAHGARATFFLLGVNALAYPDLVRRILGEGHQVANHTHSHPRLDQLAFGDVVAEIRQGGEDLVSVGAPPTDLFRPPYGRTSPTVAAAAREAGVRSVYWTECLEACSHTTLREHGASWADRAGPGDVLLAHDGSPPRRGEKLDRRPLLDALPTVLDRLTSRGLRTVTLREAGIRAVQ